MHGGSDDRGDAFETVLSEFTEAWLAGERRDPEQFCRENAHCGKELLEEINDFIYVAEGMEEEADCHAATPTGVEEEITCRKGMILGDFRVGPEIGRGGMGVVFEAEQISLRRKVALKILPPHLSLVDKAVLRFRREAEVGGRQSHPGIVSVFAVGEQEGIHYIAQEYVPGGVTLADKIGEHAGSDDFPRGYFRDVARFIAEVADALDYAHESKVIHRDIKPSNILLAENGSPKVTDFGLAKIEDALAVSRSGDLVGTPYYMSPEQAMSRQKTIDKRTDVYSLGVTLYEMLTLRLPFNGDTPHEVLKRIVLSEPNEPHRLDSRVPRDLSVICLKAMEKKPEQRYSSMAAFKEDLQRFLSGDVILAKPAALKTRIWKRVRRHPVFSAAAGVAALAVIGFIGWHFFWYVPNIRSAVEETGRQKEQAVRQRKLAEKESAKVSAINAFLINDFYGLANPLLSGKKDMTVAEAIRQVEDRVNGYVFEHPEIEAELRNVIARTYFGQSLFPEAEANARRALEIRKQIHEAAHSDLASSYSLLAQILKIRGLPDQAEAPARKALELCREIGGEDDSATVRALVHLADIVAASSGPRTAEPLIQKAYAAYCRRRTEDDFDLADFAGSVGQLFEGLGRYGDSAKLHRDCYEFRKREHGPDHILTTIALFNLAEAKRKQGDFETATRLFEEVLDHRLESFDEEDRWIATSYFSLGLMAAHSGNYQRSEELCSRALGIQLSLLGPDHPEIARIYSQIGVAQSKQKHLSMAEASYREALRIQRSRYPDGHVKLADTLNNLGTLHFRKKNWEKAAIHHKEAYDMRLNLLGGSHIKTLTSLVNLAAIKYKQNELVQAEELILVGLEGYDEARYADQPIVGSTLITLALIQMAGKKYAAAEASSRKGLSILRRKYAESDGKVKRGVDTLVSILEKAGRPEAIEPVLQESLGLLDPGSEKGSARIKDLERRLTRVREQQEGD